MTTEAATATAPKASDPITRSDEQFADLFVPVGYQFRFSTPQSEWQCFMFGNRPGGSGMVYRPAKGQVPNAFVRFMMRVCFDCIWIKDGDRP